MSHSNLRRLRKSLSVYTKKTTSKALVIFLIDALIYIGAIIGVILFNSILLKITFACIIGFKMASLFVIAHDAAHDSFTNNTILNRIIGRLAFLPCYHNYSLWLIVHNRLHHQFTNMKNVNSWSPLTKQEYDCLPIWRKKLERLYRSPIGIPFNYMIERWWKNKFFPYKRLVGEYKSRYWIDFFFALSYLVCLVSFFIYQGYISYNSNVLEMLVFGIILPFIVFSFMVGFSVYQQHTHESVPWFDDNELRNSYGHVEDVTLHVKYPQWYNFLSHNVMEHTAHHIDPRIPSYNLEKAQKELNHLYGDKMKIMKFSLRNILETIKKCKLYDYKQHCWLDFEGVPTTSPTLTIEKVEYANAA